MPQNLRVRAIVFSRPLHAELHERVRLPEMDDEGILVRTEYTTISRGTELDLYTGQMHGQGASMQWYPMLPGYMPVGVVEAVGKQVENISVGDRVVGSNLFATLDERYCTAWAGHTEMVVIGRNTHPGLAAKRAVKIPAGLPPETAGLAMLAGVAWHGVSKKIMPGAGEIVLVIGMGVIGNFSAQQCRAMGARVLVADRFENRLELARANGLEETILSQEGALKQAVLERTNGRQPDAVIEVTGESAPLREALEIVRPYGRVQAQGMYLDEMKVNLVRTLFNKNLTLSATGGETPQLTADCLQMMLEGRLSTHGMLSSVASPQDATEVYDAVYSHPERYLTCAFKW